MRLWVGLVVLLVASGARAGCDKKYGDNCRIMFSGGVNLPTNQSLCTESAMPGAPPAGQQFFYCKAGSGICTKDAAGIERCGSAGAPATGYQTWMDEGIALTQQTTVNWIGAPVSCVNNPAASRTDCTVTVAPTFNQIGTGVNTTATMAVGSGATLGPSGTGQIAATQIPGVMVDVSEYGVVADVGTDQSSQVQLAANSCVPTLLFPTGTFVFCGITLQCPNQIWQGAGKGRTIFKAAPGCLQMVWDVVSAGPVQSWRVSNVTWTNAANYMMNLNGRDVARVEVDHCGFDLCAQAGSGQLDPRAMLLSGIPDAQVHDNEFYSTCPPSGHPVLVQQGAHRIHVHHNTMRWVRDGILAAQAVTGFTPTETFELLEGVEFDHNTVDLGWWVLPTQFTNSGATVTYGTTTLNDTAVTFAGLCDDTNGVAPETCTGTSGHDIRVLTPLVTTSTSTTFAKGAIVTDANTDFVAAGVSEGNIMRTTTKLCAGNGVLAPTSRTVCTGTAGSAAWGDSCTCTADLDCASGVCRKRIATALVAQTDTTHDVVLYDEWMDDVTRRPTGNPPDGTQVIIYSFQTAEVGAYSAHQIVTTGAGWNDWNGNKTPPANGKLYEVMVRHPGDGVQINTSGRHHSVTNNYVLRAWGDAIGSYGTKAIVTGNIVKDARDNCLIMQGDHNLVANNTVRHCGTRGLAILGNDMEVSNIQAYDSPWIGQPSPFLGDIVVGPFTAMTIARNTLSNLHAERILPIANTTAGIIVVAYTGGSTDRTVIENATVAGAYPLGGIRLDPNGGTVSNTTLRYNNGATVSDNGSTGTLVIDPLLQLAQTALPTTWALGSTIGCSNCTAANPCAAGGGAAIARRIGGPAWACN